MLSSVMNFREYSIYTASNQQPMKRGMLYRSGRLHGMIEQDKAAFAQLNIGYIIDFRSNREYTELPDPYFPAVCYAHCPLSINEISQEAPVQHTNPYAGLLVHATKEDMIASYRSLPFQNPGIDCLLHTALKKDQKAILHHCSAGKDRAGVAAAVLLLALGIKEETVIQDYLASQASYPQLMDAIFAKSEPSIRQQYEAQIHLIAVTDEAYITAALAAIKERYGDFSHYLSAEYHIDEAERQQLKQKYLEG